MPQLGTLVGGVVGTIAGAAGGGLAGHAMAESVDPSAEDTYWRENYRTRPYVGEGVDYDEYAPAYRYGWESSANNPDMPYDQAEPHLEKNWAENRSKAGMEWDKAKYAVKDAWDRVSKPKDEKIDDGSSVEMPKPVTSSTEGSAPPSHQIYVVEEVILEKSRPDGLEDVRDIGAGRDADRSRTDKSPNADFDRSDKRSKTTP